MRTTLMISGTALLVGMVCFAADDDQIAPKRIEKANARRAAKAAANAAEIPNAAPAEPAGAKASVKPNQPTPAAPLAAAPRSPDEDAIRQSHDAFVKAYGEGDAKSIAAHCTVDAEWVDESGNVSQGREAIEKSLTAYFAEHPSCKLELNIDSIRFISPGVAVEDGTTLIAHADGPASPEMHYTTVHVKADGQWLAASVRDHAPKKHKQHQTQLQQLEWLLGDWVDEGDDSIVTFSCQTVDNGNFLLRKFSVLIAGQEAMGGTQRIGWDPLTGKLKAWIFDSEGGHAEGTWHRDGDKWVLKSDGVTADGETASSTSIYTFVNEHTMTWQSVHHEIAGVQMPDSEVVRIVRQAPTPSPMIATETK